MKVLVVHPGASWSTCDVEAGLCFGLQYHGCKVWRYRLDLMIEPARRWLFTQWRALKKFDHQQVKPTPEDVYYRAGIGALEVALRRQVDAVIVVAGLLFHAEAVVMMRRAGLKVYFLFTESPYWLNDELNIASICDGCWTNERTCVDAFRTVQKNAGYLPHGWHPERHHLGPYPEDAAVPAHDVVFVGSAFPERIKWFEAFDWTGVDLGLYGDWSECLPKGHRLHRFVRSADRVTNRDAVALYRRAKVGLNLYRDTPEGLPPAESLNPRAYELAACGVFTMSTERAEGREVFGSLVPVPTEDVLRDVLADTERRAAVQRELPRTVEAASWIERSKIVLGDLQFSRAA